jgi:predicted MPP superfamily phosphohydrolase
MAKRILIIFALWTTLHLYVGWRLLAPGTIGDAWRFAGWVVIALLALAPFAAFFASRNEKVSGRQVLEWVGFTAMGLSSLLIVFVLFGDVLGLRAWLGSGVFAAAVVGVVSLVFIAGMWHARRPLVVSVDVPIADLHQDLEGFRIVQLSDLHVGPTLKRDFVERIVEQANGLQPDVIALTGDVGDGYPSDVRDELAPLAALAATYGKFFVTGNHEYYWDAPGWVREVERLGFSALINAHRVVERGAARLVLAGVTDLSVSRALPGHESDPQAAVAGAPTANVRVLLAHQPKSAYAAREAGFDLQISGHTHGGQYFPFNLLVRFFQPFVAGLHRLETMWLYVSRGTGYWGPPLRLGAPAEITLLRLTRAEQRRSSRASFGRGKKAGAATKRKQASDARRE